MYNIVVYPLEPCARSLHAVSGFMGCPFGSPPPLVFEHSKNRKLARGGCYLKRRVGYHRTKKYSYLLWENLGKWVKFNSNFVDLSPPYPHWNIKSHHKFLNRENSQVRNLGTLPKFYPVMNYDGFP